MCAKELALDVLIKAGPAPASAEALCNKLPSPNHCESRDFLLVNKNLSLKAGGEM